LPLVLPNPVQRFCTTEMKIRTCDRYVKRHLGWATYTDALGLRADEPKRVLRLRQKRQTTVEPTLYGEEKTVTRASSVIPGTEIHCPLYDAGATEDDVMAFWKAQPFNLATFASSSRRRKSFGSCGKARSWRRGGLGKRKRRAPGFVTTAPATPNCSPSLKASKRAPAGCGPTRATTAVAAKWTNADAPIDDEPPVPSGGGPGTYPRGRTLTREGS
jgi:hypothetical protein